MTTKLLLSEINLSDRPCQGCGPRRGATLAYRVCVRSVGRETLTFRSWNYIKNVLENMHYVQVGEEY